MALPEPLRGEVNRLNAQLGHVAVVPVTGSAGPTATHVPLDPDAGLTRYGVSYADVTGLLPLPRGKFRRRRGRLSPAEMASLQECLMIYLGIPL